MTNATDFSTAMSETKPAGFARAINVDPVQLRGYLRRVLKIRVSDGDAFTDEAKTALIKHYHGEEAVAAPKAKKAKGSK